MLDKVKCVTRLPRLELRQLSKHYPAAGGALEVLDGISIALQHGEFAALIGPSGCGKSTLLDIAAGLELPTGGEALVDGATTAGKTGHAGYMPQKDLLFPWRSVIDNATLGLEVRGMRRREARLRVEPLVERFGLAGFERAYPFQLSGGMRQRAALLRTVVQDCAVLLLDEPFGALDSLTRSDMQVWLEQMWGQFGWTVLLVTHDIREAVYLADTVYVLSPRPARLVGRLEIDLPRPRRREAARSAPLSALEEQLTALLHAEPGQSTSGAGERFPGS